MPLRVVGDRLRQAPSQCIDRRHGERVLRGIDPDRHFHAGPFLRPTYGGTPPMVDWRTTSRRWVPHRRDLTPFGVLDSRAVERIGGRFFVLDGADWRGDDRLKYAVFEFDVER